LYTLFQIGNTAMPTVSNWFTKYLSRIDYFET